MSVRQLPSGQWQARLPRHASPNREAIGDGKTFATRELAEAYRDRVVELIELNKRQRELTAPLTTAELYEAWLAHERELFSRKYPTAAQVTSQLRTHRSSRKHYAMGAFWELPYHLVTYDQLKAWRRHLHMGVEAKDSRPLSHSYINGCTARLRKMYEWADVDPNPLRLLKNLPKKSKGGGSAEHHLKLVQQRELFRAEAIPLKDRIMIGCLMGTGLRINEFLSLKRADVELDESDPHIELRTGGKDGAPLKHREEGEVRFVELHEPAISFLEIYLARFYEERPSGRLFSGKNDGYLKHWPMVLSGLNDPEQHNGEAPLPFYVHAHQLRHTYAMSVINEWWGLPEPDKGHVRFVQHQLGHQTEDVTVREYGHLIRQRSAARQVRGQNRTPKPQLTAYGLLGIPESEFRAPARAPFEAIKS